jgi:hypothetical protein
MGHWMQLKDAEALPWMADFTRNPWPKKIIWQQSKGINSRFYWLKIPEKHLTKGQSVTADVEDNTIRINTEKVSHLIIRLSDHLLDLDKQIKISVNGQKKFSGKVKRSAREIIKSLDQRADPTSVATAIVSLKL